MFMRWQRGRRVWRHRPLQVRVDYCPSITSMSFISYRYWFCFKISTLLLRMHKKARDCSELAKTSIDCSWYVYSATWDGSHGYTSASVFALRGSFEHNFACVDIYDVYLCIICAFVVCKLFILCGKCEGRLKQKSLWVHKICRNSSDIFFSSEF